MSLNASVLCLLVALAIGGAATLLGLDACRLSSALLPGMRPAAAFTAPALCLAWAAGLAFTSVRGRRRPRVRGAAIAGRWLAAAAAGAFASPALLAAWTSPAPPLSAGVRAVAAGLPFTLAPFCLGAALPLLLEVRARGAPLTRGAVAMLLGWIALGSAAAAWRWLPLLADGVRPTDVAAGALAGAALLCGALAGSPAAAVLAPPAAAGVSTAPGGPDPAAARAPAASTARRAWAARLDLALNGLACGVALPALLRLAAALDGDTFATRAHVALLLACGGLLAALFVASMDPPTSTSSAVAWTAFAWIAPHLAGGVSPRFGGIEAAIPFLIPPLVLGTALIRAADREPVAAQPGRGGATLRAWGLRGALLAAGLGLGAAVSGLFLLGAPGHPTPLTLQRTGLLAAALLLVPQVLAAGWQRTPLLLAGLAVGMLVAGPSPDPFPWRADDPQAALLRQVEDARGVLSVVGEPGGRAELQQGGQLDAPEGAQPLLARRMGRISASFKPAAERALVLGLGSGLLPASFAAVTPASVECVEASTARLSLFTELPYEAGQSGRAGEPVIVNDDPGAWLLQHPRTWDLIVGQPAVPDRSGDALLGSAEHALAMRAALREGGVAVQWYSLERLPWPAFASAARAFLAVFPDARLFTASLRADVPLVALVGGLANGLPHQEAVDALLAHAPSAAGPPAAVDVLDLYVGDAWALLGKLRDEPTDTASQPWMALRSEGRSADRAWIARTNLRLLAELSQPLDTTSFEARPVNDKENRRLGAELTARSAALTSLLLARAAWRELRDAPPGSLSDTDRTALENELGSTLLAAWKAAPGHLDVRDTLAEWAAELVGQDRRDMAGALLQSAVDIAPDARLLGGLGGVLLQLDRADEALAILGRARELAPADRTVLVNLGTAQVFAGQDATARDTLHAARAALAPSALPVVPDVALRLLDGEQAAVAPARELLAQIPAGAPWRRVFERLLRRQPPGGAPPAQR